MRVSAERVRQYLMEHGVSYQTHTHPTAYTTAETAEAEEVPGRQMAKVVMLIVDDRLTMAVIPGDRMLHVDTARMALGAQTLRLATEEEFAPAFPDCETGAEPPFGSLYGVPMVLDRGLQAESITFNAGTHREVITMSLDDYLRSTEATRADLVS